MPVQEFVFVWKQLTRRGKFLYRVNREHPLVAEALRTNRKTLEAVLRLIEETVPIPLLTITNSEHPDKHSSPFEASSDREIASLLTRVYAAMRESGLEASTAMERLRVMEPFDRFPALVASFEETVDHNEGP